MAIQKQQNFRVKRGLEVGVGKTVLYASPSGNIGIGTTQPSQSLDVSGTLNVSGVSTFQSNVLLLDGDFLSFGTGQDFKIGHSWNSNSITMLNGNLTLTDGSSNSRLQLTNNGDWELKDNAGTTRLKIVPAGVNVTGILTATTFSGSGANLTSLPVPTTITVADESSDTACNVLFTTAATGNLGPKSGTNLTFNSSNGTLTATAFSGSGAGVTSVNAATLGGISSTSFLRSDAADVKTSGHLKFNDGVILQLGSDADLQIYNNGSASTIGHDGPGNLTIYNGTDNADIILQSDNGSGGVANYILLDGSTGQVNLYHYGLSKLSTTGAGVTVTGIVTATSFSGDGSSLTGIEAGGSAEFNTGISSSNQLIPLAFESTLFTFPATAGKQYVIESINVANVDSSVGVGTTINIIASIQDATAAEQTYIAYNIPIETGGLIELIRNPMVAGPSDVIKMWSTNDGYIGVSSVLDVYMNFTEYTSTDYISKFASTVSVASTATTTLYTSTGNPTMIEKIGFANRTDSGDYPVSIRITNGTSTSYLAKNLIIPRYSAVDILDRHKRIETGAKIEVEVGATSTIDIIIAGKKIT